jgi:PAS domain S-box-containing protein
MSYSSVRELVKSFDWSQTATGPRESWPTELRTLVETVPLILLWGRDGCMIYNDAYANFAGTRHPKIFGMPVEQGWPEAAEFNRHVLDTCFDGGTLAYREREFTLLRNGEPEKVWLDLSYSAVPGEGRDAAGVLAIVVETTARTVAEQKRTDAERALHLTNERLQLALNTEAVLGTWIWDVRGNTVSGDERFARTFSLDVGSAIEGVPESITRSHVHPDDLPRVLRMLEAAMTLGQQLKAEYRILQPDGAYRWVQATGSCEYDVTGAPSRFPGILLDIHERKVAEEALLTLTQTLEDRVSEAIAARANLEEQLRHAQKMDAIGKLTGGVAHDFNNVLQVISGNLQMLAIEHGADKATLQRIAAATDAVHRGATLASQLLAFARRQPLDPKPLSPKRLIAEMAEMLNRTLDETIAISVSVADDVSNIFVDRSQLENALLNVAINARDAMPSGGRLTIAADNRLVARDPSHAELPRSYVTFTITDTGAGMSPEVLEHAFEPFFTTKPDGHGTGLGLSMVFGFVEQSGGHTTITSQPGQGTTVQLYFPRCDENEEAISPSQQKTPAGGTETVLVVEDDHDVRRTAVGMLEQLGYQVVEASNGDDALIILDSGLHIDLLFTDVVMPGHVKSAELAQLASLRVPAVPVLFTSGYTRDIIFHHGKLDSGVFLLRKPYRVDDLATKVRSVLDEHASRPEVREHRGGEQNRDGDNAANSLVTVLLVEDDDESRAAMSELLTAYGFACIAAASAEEALPLLALTPFDILLTDINLPGISGPELARTAKTAQPLLSVFFISGFGSEANIGEPIDGAQFLVKPVDFSKFQREAANLQSKTRDVPDSSLE